jgi:hypothetical protein
MLLPLAEVLRVSVVEILNGKKMEQNEVRTASDVAIVNTMKKFKQKLILGVMSVLILVAVLLAIYPVYKYISTVSINDTEALEQKANQYIGTLNTRDEDVGLELIKYKQKGEYLVALMRNEHQIAAVVFTRDRLFSQRFSPTGMSCSNKLGNISFHCFGENGLTANIFYGVDIDSSISKYRFEYCGVEYVCPVEKGTILDIFLDINEGFTNAHGIELLE